MTQLPASPTGAICADCIFYKKVGVADGVGWCHRFPPIQDAVGGTFVFPNVSAKDFCGEFLHIDLLYSPENQQFNRLSFEQSYRAWLNRIAFGKRQSTPDSGGDNDPRGDGR